MARISRIKPKKIRTCGNVTWRGCKGEATANVGGEARQGSGGTLTNLELKRILSFHWIIIMSRRGADTGMTHEEQYHNLVLIRRFKDSEERKSIVTPY